MSSRVIFIVWMVCYLWNRTALSDHEDAAPRLGARQVIQARLGLEIEARNGPCGPLTCSFPLPIEWPEQKILNEEREASDHITRVELTTIEGGVRQVQFKVARLGRGQTARLVYRLEIERRELLPPTDPSALIVPLDLDKSFRRFLGPSPSIETGHRTVKKVGQELPLTTDLTAWQKAQAIHRFTEQRIRYSGVKALKGARRALEDGDGDCEERTSVFVAMCRLKGIPARSVWIPQHAYSEFYLTTATGRGYWFPAESVGGTFGQMKSGFIILQKGDNFRDPMKGKRQRYITETAKGNARPGDATPILRPIQEIQLVDSPQPSSAR